MRPFKNVVRGFSLVRTTLKGRTTKVWGRDTLEMLEFEREIKIKQPLFS